MEFFELKEQLIPLTIKRKKIKHLYMRFDSQGGIEISCNHLMKKEQIIAFLHLHKQKIWSVYQEYKNRPLLQSGSIMVLGQEMMLVQDPHAKKAVLFSDGVHIPLAVAYKKQQELLDNFYKELTIHAAKQLMPKYQMLLPQANLSDITLESRKMKSRFGTCYYQRKAIYLNSIFGRLDPIYLESTFAHELVHLTIPNHSKAFYKQLYDLFPMYEQVHQELNRRFRFMEV
ncbi:MAG: YgjP-like metallopeptidase domain-containing protein [Candidatus Izemoplasmatales bacterium]|nr:DUF45 domain-containing protein [bacterium]MDZ4195834.1 YgjP-like metallopeptidase domain-containing protein [Candidatus Izemoplasmatales bacterium]